MTTEWAIRGRLVKEMGKRGLALIGSPFVALVQIVSQWLLPVGVGLAAWRYAQARPVVSCLASVGAFLVMYALWLFINTFFRPSNMLLTLSGGLDKSIFFGGITDHCLITLSETGAVFSCTVTIHSLVPETLRITSLRAMLTSGLYHAAEKPQVALSDNWTPTILPWSGLAMPISLSLDSSFLDGEGGAYLKAVDNHLTVVGVHLVADCSVGKLPPFSVEGIVQSQARIERKTKCSVPTTVPPTS